MIRIRSAVPAILYVLLIVGLHLVLIEYLGIRIEGSATELRKEIGKVYFLPLLLCIINSFMLTKIRRMKYRVTWFLVTVIPSYLLLLFLKAIQDVEDNDYGVVVPIEFFP
ncbi:hypothetical protein [Paenibacillus tepidiphilus]|uniref:hypothetical protein n=1 Tax=Paenibacillus tepidiphilus TaxID=2608683 RepID=UPI00123885F4|nr:hypothetical protein [Paenibacillus tepidiphilus]